MASSQSQPKGPDEFNFVGMNDEDFELMNFLLARLEFERTFKPANVNDGGADTVQRSRESSTEYDRCWQSKHYPKEIRWTKCEASLKKARETWRPKHYTFIFPRDLTAKEEKIFSDKFGGADITVDYWNASELHARLIGSDDGERIARWFFDSTELERKEFLDAIAAGVGGGPIDSVSQALERLANVGAYLADKDPFFWYPSVVHPHGSPAPGMTPGTVMSLIRSDGKTETRTDVVPVAPEVMARFAPAFALTTTPDEAGKQAGEQLQALLAEGNEAQIEEGLTLTFTKLPPGLEHLLGEPVSGKFIFSRPEVAKRAVAPWRACLTAGSDLASDPSVDIHLMPVEPEGDWAVWLTGRASGLTATLMMRMQESGGQLTFNMHYARDDSPVREQLAVIEFLRALESAGQLLLTDIGDTSRPPFTIPVPQQQDAHRLDQLEAFFRDVVTIEDWADVRFELPSDMLIEDARTVAAASEDITRGGYDGTLSEFEVTASKAGVENLRANPPLAVEQQWRARIFGQVIDLGYTHIVFTDYEVVSAEPVEGTDDEFLVRIEPKTPEGSSVQATLSKTPLTSAPADENVDAGE